MVSPFQRRPYGQGRGREVRFSLGCRVSTTYTAACARSSPVVGGLSQRRGAGVRSRLWGRGPGGSAPRRPESSGLVPLDLLSGSAVW